MSRSFLMVLPKEMRSAPTPRSRQSSISLGLATSKLEPSSRSSDDDLRRRIGLHRVEHARERQVAAQLACRPRPTTSRSTTRHGRRRLLLGEKAGDLLVDDGGLCDRLGRPCGAGEPCTTFGMSLPAGAATRAAASARATMSSPLRKWGSENANRNAGVERAPECRSVQTARFAGSSAAATAGVPDMPGSGVRAGRCGPASDCNHIDLPLGTGPR